MEVQNLGAVPVFNCLVYISTDGDAGVRARVGNLADLEATAPSEREALAKIVTAFKQRVAQLTQEETPIPWINPPLPVQPNEQQRYVPVHL